MRRRTYTVTWQRAGEPHIYVCQGISATVAFARLLNALRASGGPITVHSARAERARR